MPTVFTGAALAGVFTGGGGRDLIYGGSGGDTIDASGDDVPDRVNCGTGFDAVFADPSGTVLSNCNGINPGQ